MPIGSYTFAPVIFLDTNQLQFMISYLLNAKKYGLLPYGKQTTLQEVKEKLSANFPKSSADHLLGGCRMLAYIKGKSQSGNIQVLISHFSIAELWYGWIDGKAHTNMALMGIPYRMRQRIGDISELVLSQLSQTDFDQISGELNGLVSELDQRLGKNIEYAENEVNFKDIQKILSFLQSRTFLDVIDCWLYSCALYHQADEFRTSDRHLQKVINNIHNPSALQDSEEQILWQSVQKDLTDILQKILLTSDSGATLLCRAPGGGLPELSDDISGLER